MQIIKDSVVTLNYRVTDSDGDLVDAGEQPIVYLHGGYGGIFDRLEEALHGKSVGDALEIKLQPNEAFGDYDADLVTVEPRDLFPDNIEVGMQFERATEDDDSDGMLYTITEIADDRVVVDANHPLAGIALIFSCTIADVRPATADEITHGHVHGDDRPTNHLH